MFEEAPKSAKCLGTGLRRYVRERGATRDECTEEWALMQPSPVRPRVLVPSFLVALVRSALPIQLHSGDAACEA